jgi:hypothetical protein
LQARHTFTDIHLKKLCGKEVKSEYEKHTGLKESEYSEQKTKGSKQ